MINTKQLAELGWRPEKASNGDTLQHRISGEICHWYAGMIEARPWSAWIGTDSGSVYLHGGDDMAFDAFVGIVANGWPVARVLPGARSLFWDED